MIPLIYFRCLQNESSCQVIRRLKQNASETKNCLSARGKEENRGLRRTLQNRQLQKVADKKVKITGFSERNDLGGPGVEVVEFLLGCVFVVIPIGRGNAVTILVGSSGARGGGSTNDILFRRLVEVAVGKLFVGVNGAVIGSIAIAITESVVASRLGLLGLGSVEGLECEVPGHSGEGAIDIGAGSQAEFGEDLMLDGLEPEVVRTGSAGGVLAVDAVDVVVLLVRAAGAGLVRGGGLAREHRGREHQHQEDAAHERGLCLRVVPGSGPLVDAAGCLSAR